MIRDRTRLEQRSFLILDDPRNVGMKFFAEVIGQPGFPVLGGEDQMHEDLGEGLRHGVVPLQGTGGGNHGFPGRCPGAITWCPFRAKADGKQRANIIPNRRFVEVSDQVLISVLGQAFVRAVIKMPATEWVSWGYPVLHARPAWLQAGDASG